MGRRYALSEIKKALIKVLSDKGFFFSVIARDIEVISNLLQDPEAYGTKKSTGCSLKQSPTTTTEECHEKLQGKEYAPETFKRP